MVERNNNLFLGEMIRLCAAEPRHFAKAASRWERDSEYCRLMSGRYVQLKSEKGIKDQIEKIQKQESPRLIEFEIHTLADDRLVGNCDIELNEWQHSDAFMSIGLGERTYWGKGYGTDALRVLLRYAFYELNLHRVSLNVIKYNTRAIRSYQKVGFIYEGRAKKQLHRDGKRWDLIFMGILREEWQRRISVSENN